MQIFYTDEFVLPLPPGHRFPMEKYRLLREAVATPGGVSGARLGVPDATSDSELLLVHTREYLDALLAGTLEYRAARAIGFPWSTGMVERSRRSVGATVAAARAALADGAGANLAGGTHHAFPDRGGGFCVFNDVAVAARVLQQEGAVSRVAVLDLDVHQGDGTAAIFRNDPSVFTVSVHGGANYPFRKERSDLDLPLDDRAGDDAFLPAVERAVEAAVEDGRPDLLFYIAGADPHEGDRLGRLSVTREALAHRDHLVVEACRGRGIPVAVVMGGGYGQEIRDTVAIHLASVKAVAELVGS
ncbi:MAG: histone deacetylase, partial [Gemmatimonadales bacterium]